MEDNNFSLFIRKLSQRMQNSNNLEILINQFILEYGLIPIIGFELEFYVTENTDIKKLEECLGRKIKTEKGKNQYEIDLEPSSDIIEAIKIFNYYKLLLVDSAKKIGGEIFFESKPFQQDYGSSVHIHINFLNKNGINFFDVEENILDASKSICNFILQTFLVFANTEDHYKRLKIPNMNPVNISMGKNNRTTCLRIPYSLPKRIEHRLSAPDVDLYIAIYVILKSIYNGIQNPKSIFHLEIIHGNAFDTQYNCVPFPNTAEEAKKIFNLDFFIDKQINIGY